jgi:hypothetical protein
MFHREEPRRPKPRRKPIAALLALALAGLGFLAGPAGAGDALDRSAIRAHVEARAAESAEGDRKVVYKAYLKLVRELSKPSARGLSDDYKVLSKVSAALAKVLAADGELRQLLDGLLDAAEAALALNDDELEVYDELLKPGKGLSKVNALAAKAQDLAQAARQLRLAGNEKAAIAGAGKASKAYDGALAAALKLRKTELTAAPEWSLPLPQLAGALLSVWGGAGPAPELFAVGASDGGEPLFLLLRRFAEAWVRLPTRLTGDLWWVAGVPGSGVWASGTQGNVLRYDPATGAVEDHRTHVDATLFGIWGSGPDDVWTVGGDVLGFGPRPAILHWDGAEWTAAAAPAEADGKVLFKVFGTAKNDVWACGQLGLLIRYDGAAWTNVPSGAQSALLTVHGPSPMTAVGGAGVAAVLVEREPAGAFAAKPITAGTPSLNGVFVPRSGDAIAVGFSNTVLRRTSGSWAPIADVPAGTRDLHAVWIDDEGNAVMAGGDLFAGAGGTDGVLAAWGHRKLPSEIVPRARFREQVQPILYNSCALAGCHLAPFANEGLDFSTAELSLATSVGLPSKQSPLRVVAPGRPSKSYLWHKLKGTYLAVGGSGVPMPQGAEPLPPADLEILYAWILEGALDN